MKLIYKILLSFGALIALVIFVFSTNAQGLVLKPSDNVVGAFRQYKDIDNLILPVPTVVEVPFEQPFLERFDFAVFNKTTGAFEPHFFKQETLINETPIFASTDNISSSAFNMTDKDVRTYAEFALPENIRGSAQIILSGPQPITSSALTILLDNHVALPTSIEIRTIEGGGSKIVVANRKMNGQTIQFPRTTASSWIINLTYGQPLRITEIRLSQENAKRVSSRGLRFLAQPGHSYRVYFDSDRYVLPAVGESGNLSIDEDVYRISDVLAVNNPGYMLADVDQDGRPDIFDNCVTVANLDQLDANDNKRGDACDDFDRDNVINSKDNCPNHPNRNQDDEDGDDIGDVCDEEESRITEKYKWIPWIGIVFAAAVLVFLFILTAGSIKNNSSDTN